jgi:Na+-transporting methylmalonyl-CoA/oxaloacetate decarboxylase gamma subunit
LRPATLVVCGVAAFLLTLLLVVAVAMMSKPSTADAKAPAKHKAPGRPEPKRPTLTRAQTKVLVLNANGITGAAATEASRVRARGYKIAATGNAALTAGQSVVLYRPGHKPEAKRLARDEGIALVGPLDGLTPRQLHGAQVVIVLGT